MNAASPFLTASSVGSWALEGLRAVITGASGGIGSEVARAFSAAGAQVLAVGRSRSDSLADLQTEILDRGGRCELLTSELASDECARSLREQIFRTAGGADILVNVAGSYTPRSLIGMAMADWRSAFQTNLDTSFCAFQAVGPLLVQQQSGVILNITSIAARRPSQSLSHYCASKAALLSFTRAAAQELGRFGVRVNAVSPGLINRDTLRDTWADGLRRWTNRAPLGRVGEPQDVASACLYLASPGAAWITGQELVVDGGMTVAPDY